MSIRQGITDSQINTRIPIYFTRNHRFGCKALPTEHKNWSTSDWCQITVMFITVYLSVSLFFFLFFFSPLFFSLTHDISLPPFFPSPTFLSLPFFPSASQDMEMPVGEDSHFVIKVVSTGMAVLWVRAFLSLYTLCHLFRELQMWSTVWLNHNNLLWNSLFHFLSLSLALCLLGFSWIWEGIIRNCCVNMLINKPIIVRQSHATVLSIYISTFPHISPSYFIVCRSTMRMVLCFLSSSSIRGQLNLRTVSINKFNQSTSWCSRNMTKSS